MNTEEKAVAVIKRIVSSPETIKEIIDADNEFYFKFQGHAFSILKRIDHEEYGPYTFYIYPKWNSSTNELSSIFAAGNDFGVKIVAFHASRLGKEAEAQFAKLYELIERKAGGVEDILDDILQAPEF